MSLRWKGEWDEESAEAFTMNCHNSRKKNDDEEEARRQRRRHSAKRKRRRYSNRGHCGVFVRSRDERGGGTFRGGLAEAVDEAARELVGQCANALEFLKAMSEIEMERKGENIDWS